MLLMVVSFIMVITIFKLGYELRKKLKEIDKMKTQFKELMSLIEVTI